MPYSDHFQHADDVVNHLNSVVPQLQNPLLQAKYVGFVAVAAVTVYEMAIKEIFIEFGAKKHKVFGAFTESFFYRINGRIKLQIIKKDYVEPFGEKYKNRFDKILEANFQNYMRSNKRDIKNSYANLITWRNDFAHEGRFKTNATYAEVIQSYEDGKEVIHSLAKSMQR